MRHEILYQPAFAVAKIMLDPGDAIRAESGAMLSMSPTITLESGVTGGLGKAFGRMLGGESIFQSTFRATSGPGEVLLAPPTVGDIVALSLNAEGYMVTSGCFLAGGTTLNFETKASGKSFFAGEGLFLMRVSGSGLLLLCTFGALHAVQLAPGQPYVVDSGHIVAFSESVKYDVRRAARSLLGSLTSGEGFVAEFTGPGIVYIQTRAPQAFAGYLGRFLGKSS